MIYLNLYPIQVIFVWAIYSDRIQVEKTNGPLTFVYKIWIYYDTIISRITP